MAIYDHGKYNKEFTIQSDGSFEVDTSLLNKDDLVVFVVNSSSKTIFGHLNLKASNDEKLELLDTSKMEKDLNLGNVDCADNCSSTETLSTTTSFKSSELDNLQNISRSDDAVALYSNNWRNPNLDAQLYVSFSLDNLTNVINNYGNIDNFSKTNNYHGMSPKINGDLDSAGSLYTDNSSPFTGGGCISSSLCINGQAISAFLYPPSAIKHSNKQPSSTSPTSDNLSNDADNTTPIGLRSRDTVWWSNDGKTIGVYGPQVDSLPAGDWKLTYTDNTSIGNFEFVGADPFDNASTFKGFIPSLKVNSDNSSGKLTSINLKFYRQSSTGSFENVSTTFLESVAWNIFCSYVLKTDTNNSINFPGSDNGNISTSSTEYEFAPTSDLQTNDLQRIFCSYKIGQAQYSFAHE
ncbi:MAG: hypothetical protein H8E38_07020 [SAR324 cluster bacterium]|nr:hypothetical protein [SAR324 cluster bacterium]